jgi:penicillin-binding protein 2
MAGVTLHDRQREVYVFKTRVLIAAVCCVLGMLLLAIRLLILQVFHHDVFSTLSQNNRLHLVAIPPNRGLIYDRNGVILAENRPSYQLEVVPEDVQDMDGSLAALRQLINMTDPDIERFRKEMKRSRRFEAVPLRFNLTEDEVAVFAVNRYRFPGFDIKASLTRHYPFGPTTAHLLGYVSRIDDDDLKHLDESNYRATTHIGKLGIEQYYEKTLHGMAGYQQVEVNVEGRVLRVVEERDPVPGSDLYLNVDIRVQQVAEAALGEHAGAVVALEPTTGAVLAMVSKPAFDPHPFVNGISTEAFRALQDAKERPLYDRALRGQYPPGSTVKPLLGLAALERGLQPASRSVNCWGHYQLPGDRRKYRDWKKTGHGVTSMHKAVVESCDVFFYDMAYRMGIDAMADYARPFGLGSPTGIDIKGEKAGLLPNTEWKRKRLGFPWYPGETLSAGIGQGYMLMTPVQLAYETAVLAANGKGYRPQVVQSMQLPGQPPQAIAPVLQAEVPIQQQANWDSIRRAMIDVVHSDRGTARSASWGVKYQIAGKTGTAQVIGVAQNEEYDEEKIAKEHRDHALFIAYAPAEAPRIAVGVLVENGGHGGSTAAPVARKVMDQYLIAGVAEVQQP